MSLAWPAARGTSLAPARVVVQRQVHWRRNTIERPARGRLACGRLQLHASFQVLRRRQMQRPNSHTHVATAQLAATDASAQGGKQETAPVTIELRPGETIYFAYGSNMAPSVLTGRRRVRPRLSIPAVAPRMHLSFGMLGFPFSEPAFATIVGPQHPLIAGGADAPPVHGVLHVITQQDWRWICKTEGVGSASAGYQVVTMDCQPYTARSACGGQGSGGGGAGVQGVRASTLQGAAASLHDSRRQALPSARYLTLLRQGAAHHGLDSLYQSYLSSLESYSATDPWSTPWRAAGALASAAVMMSAAAPGVPLVVASQLLSVPGKLQSTAGSASSGAASDGNGSSRGGSSSSSSGGDGGVGSSRDLSGLETGGASVLASASAQLGASAMRATWAVHDVVLSGVFGSGCSNKC